MSGPGRRTWPAVLALLLIPPFVAELLLGDIALPSLGVALLFVPLYGCGALLVRELARRTGRGWPTIALLAGAYAVLEEGFATGSLFNPDFAGLRLLDQAPVPFLGTGAHWAVYVLSLHVVWSITTTIALAEALFPARAREPWLRRRGLVVTGVVFGLAVALFAVASSFGAHPYVLTPVQVAATAVVAVALVVAAFALRPRPARVRPGAGAVPAPVVVAVLALVATGVLRHAPALLAGWASPVVSVAVLVVMALALHRYGRRAAWTPVHTFAAAAGATLTYAWSSFLQAPVYGGAGPLVDHLGDAVFTAVGVVLLVVAGRRVHAGRDGQVKTEVRCSSIA